MCVERAVQQNARKNKHQSHEIVYTINKVCGAQRLRPNSRSILKIQTGTHAEFLYIVLPYKIILRVLCTHLTYNIKYESLNF